MANRNRSDELREMLRSRDVQRLDIIADFALAFELNKLENSWLVNVITAAYTEAASRLATSNDSSIPSFEVILQGLREVHKLIGESIDGTFPG